MINITSTLTHDVALGTEAYFLTPTLEAKLCTIKGLGMFLEQDKPDETIILVELETEEGKKETGGANAKDLFLTIELAEAEITARKTESEANQVEELKNLYKAILDRRDAVAAQLAEKGIELSSFCNND